MKNRNWLIGTAVMTAAIVTVVPAQNSVEAASLINQVIYYLDNENVSISFDDFTDAVNGGVLTNLDIKYVTLSDGKYYSFGEFTDALNGTGSLITAIDTLIKGDFDVQLDQVSEGQIDVDSGSVTNGAVNKDFQVLSIK